MLKLFASAVFAMLFCFSTANAADYEVNFTASNFQWGGGGDQPQLIVSGVLLFSAESLYSTIDQITAFDLVIAGHSYAINDIDWFGDTMGAAIGGKLNGYSAINSGTDDFYLNFSYLGDIHSGQLSYATSSSPFGIWSSYGDDFQFTVTEVSPVPEPGNYAMMLAGALFLGAVNRRRKA